MCNIKEGIKIKLRFYFLFFLLIHVITVLSKNWKLEAKYKHKPVGYYDVDVDDDLYVLKDIGKSMARSPQFKI